MNVTALAGWTPFRAGWTGTSMVVDWCHFGDRPFVEPFFYESVARAMTEPFNMAFQQRTPIDALESLPRGVPIAGFIFHMSRCGSTLCSQALATLPGNIVISEAVPINAVIRAPEFGPATISDSARWLAAMINAFAQPRFPNDRHLFIKFAAANTFDLPLITRVFPDVPWIFVYRNPVEILASLQDNASADFLPGAIFAERLGLRHDGLWTMDGDAYRAHCLAGIGQAALSAGRDDPRALFLNYRELPEALWETIPAHFGFTLSESDRAAILETSQRNAKRPSTSFSDDRAAKQAAAAHLRGVAEEIVGPTIMALDSLERR